jgi:hypothetical protein
VYRGHTSGWTYWFGGDAALAATIGCALLFFYFVHYWGESICCMRSSHLTNRGIITNGPFRWTKHPVYVVKFCAWLITFIPFASAATVLGDIRSSLSFLAFAAIYVMRSWVEERLLSSDSTYVAYALWIDDHGIFRFVGRHIPLFRYSWRLDRWRRAGLVDPDDLTTQIAAPGLATSSPAPLLPAFHDQEG